MEKRNFFTAMLITTGTVFASVLITAVHSAGASGAKQPGALRADGSKTASAWEESLRPTAVSRGTSGNQTIGGTEPGANVAVAELRWQPRIIEYGGRIYLSSAKHNLLWTGTTVKPEKKLYDYFTNYVTNYVTISDSHLPADIHAYSIQGIDPKKSICLSDEWEPYQFCKGRFIRMDYVCDTRFSISGSDYSLSLEKCCLSDVQNPQSAYTLIWDYTCERSNILPLLKERLDGKLGSLSSGCSAYKIKDTDPRDALYLNKGSEWYLVKNNQYDMKDTLIGPAVVGVN